MSKNTKPQTPNTNTDRAACACDICVDLPAGMASELPEPTTLSAWLAQVSPARISEALSPEQAALN